MLISSQGEKIKQIFFIRDDKQTFPFSGPLALRFADVSEKRWPEKEPVYCLPPFSLFFFFFFSPPGMDPVSPRRRESSSSTRHLDADEILSATMDTPLTAGFNDLALSSSPRSPLSPLHESRAGPSPSTPKKKPLIKRSSTASLHSMRNGSPSSHPDLNSRRFVTPLFFPLQNIGYGY